MKAKVLICLSALVAAAPAAGRPAAASGFTARLLAAQNALRSQARVPPLVWDNALAAGAAVWAQQLARTGVFQHSDRHARRGIGENMWYGMHGAYSPEAMVGALGGREAQLCSRHLPQRQPDRKLVRRLPLHAGDLADDPARRVRGRDERTRRLSRLSLRDRREHRWTSRPLNPRSPITLR